MRWLFILVLAGIFWVGCEEEARQFDFTKNLDFVFRHNRSVASFDSVGMLKVVDHKSLNDYRDYAQDYLVNDVSYRIIEESGNRSGAGKAVGSYVSFEDTIELFVIEGLDFDNMNHAIPLSENQLIELSSLIKEQKNLKMIMSYDLDQEPVHIKFVLSMSITVAVQFDF